MLPRKVAFDAFVIHRVSVSAAVSRSGVPVGVDRLAADHAEQTPGSTSAG